MNTRKLMINIHLFLAALFLPLMLLMPLTGSLYILGFKGQETKIEIFRTKNSVPTDEKERETFFKEILSKNGVEASFEYVRATKTEYILRPTTRVYYLGVVSEGDELAIFRVEPDLLKRMIELHKGHGPVAMRWFEVAFGIALLLTVFSGIWLALTVKAYRTITLSAFAVGLAIISICMI